MTVVLDASVTIGLAKGRVFAKLRDLFDEVLTVPGVRTEVVIEGQGRAGSAALARAIQRGWVRSEVPQPSSVAQFSVSLQQTDREVLGLTLERKAAHLLTDDLGIRKEADRFGISYLGCPEIVVLLCRHGLVPRAKPVLDLMQRRLFGISEAVYEKLLEDLDEL